MPVELRLPNINGMTEKEQLAQIRSYLYQFIPQLQWALNNVTTNSTTVTPTQTQVVSSGSSSVAAETSLNAIKSLIISSADIVDAYYDIITERLEGSYSALSEFGSFTEKTSKTLVETSAYTEELYENIQTIESDVKLVEDGIEGVWKDINKTKGYIKTGELYKEGNNPVYGIEIGQDNDGASGYEKIARFTANKLEFFTPGSENAVAWISGFKLYINNADIQSELKLGRVIFDPSDGLALKWG